MYPDIMNPSNYEQKRKNSDNDSMILQNFKCHRTKLNSCRLPNLQICEESAGTCKGCSAKTVPRILLTKEGQIKSHLLYISKSTALHAGSVLGAGRYR